MAAIEVLTATVAGDKKRKEESEGGTRGKFSLVQRHMHFPP